MTQGALPFEVAPELEDVRAIQRATEELLNTLQFLYSCLGCLDALDIERLDELRAALEFLFLKAQNGMAGRLPVEGDRPGYVYLMQSGRHYKIGRSRDPERRRKDFGSLPDGMAVRHRIFCRDYVASEEYLHRRYAAYRIKGEWFALPDRAVADFCAIVSDLAIKDEQP